MNGLAAGSGTDSGLKQIEAWFALHGWEAYAFQKQAWLAAREGESGLIHVPTGAGKTYAAFMGPLSRLIDDFPRAEAPVGSKKKTVKAEALARGLRILYVTPLKAVSRDIELALKAPIEEMNLGFDVQSRTGDTKASQRAKQKKNLPEILITTPESLSLLLSYKESAASFASLQTVIIDEWHELLQSKRGVLMELNLARLRRIQPQLQTWALTATLANLEDAARAACGVSDVHPAIIKATLPRPVVIQSLLPEPIEAFPWAGHSGLKMLPQLLEWLDPRTATLIFTNTRSQAERWYQAIAQARPDWAYELSLHHGSLDRKERERVEAGVKSGELRFVVCTSSLDLGVDFGHVGRVVQIGSPKGIARLIQRAGRSGHKPGATANLLFVPTHALELVEISAARDALDRHDVEPRLSLRKPMDVLVQFLVTRALGGGFTFSEIFAELSSAWAYRDLTEQELRWALDFVMHGGQTLRAYEAYHKVIMFHDRYVVDSKRIAQVHRMNIGTISSDATVELLFQRGKKIGQVEESFVAKLKKGDTFVYGGRLLEFLRMKDLKAHVRLATGKATATPSWSGGRLPFSATLAHAIRETLGDAAQGVLRSAEMKAVQPILKIQRALSDLPREGELLIETLRSREGSHLFLYPFEGRPLHEGLGSLLALRFSQKRKGTFAISANDYGIEIMSAEPFPFADFLSPDLFSAEGLEAELVQSLNMASLAKSQFREIARIGGLVFQTFPGQAKTMRQVQASSALLFDVFQKYDPQNLLLKQAEKQVLEQQLETTRLLTTLERLKSARVRLVDLERPTPLAFPLMAERLSARLSNETLMERLERMKSQWINP